MKNYTIMFNEIEFDESKTYMDYYREKGKGVLVILDLEYILDKLVTREIPVDNTLKKHMEYLSRWTIDAPRKRINRKFRLDGITVLTTDELFENFEDGEEIIDNLENSGKFAEYFLREVYGVDSTS